MTAYTPRSIDAQLDFLVANVPAFAIEGAKGVGKTASAQQHAKAALYLDDPTDQLVAGADPTFSTINARPLLLDEWQYTPQVWNTVRRAVDAGAPPGSFILTGSASPQPESETHSGAGRILGTVMRPMTIAEKHPQEPKIKLSELFDGQPSPQPRRINFTIVDYCQAAEQSGFPAIWQLPDIVRTEFLDDYLRRIIDRDVPQLGVAVRAPETMRRWLAAYAAASSTTAAYSSILDATTAGDGSQPAKTTTMTFRDLLSKIFILDPVPAWNSVRNPLKRVAQAPKHQLVDPALSLRLLGYSGRDLLTGRASHFLGQVIESLATLSVRVAAQTIFARTFHFRIQGGNHEVDLVVESNDGRLGAFEVKAAAAIKDGDLQHLRWFSDKFADDLAFSAVLYTGPVCYQRPDGIWLIPIAMLA